MRSVATRRRLSPTGIAFMAIGLGLVIFELRSNFMLSRLGYAGHLVILTCGTAFSVWGLKDIVAQLFPRLAGRGYRFLLPREGWVYLSIMCFLFIGSILGRSNLLLMVFSIMAGPFIMNGWFTFMMLRKLRVRRQLPERAMAGDTFAVTVTLENRKSWLSVWLMTVHDSVTRGQESLIPEVLFVRVPPSSARQGAYQIRLTQRGRYDFDQLNVTTRFPLGLVQRGVGLDVAQRVLVYPRLGRLHAEWRRLMTHSMELVSHVRSAAGTFRDEMHRIREYRQGDDPRLIHWPTSARTNELMVCEYQETRDRDLNLIVDAWLPAKTTEGDAVRLERGLSFAATICADYLRYSRQSSLAAVLFGKRRVDWSGDAAESQLDALLDAFALLEPSRVRTVESLCSEIESDLGTRRRTVIVTTRPDALRNHLTMSQSGFPADVNIFGTSAAELSEIFSEGE